MLAGILVSILALPIVFFHAAFGDVLPKPQIIVKPAPIEVKGIYWTAYTAGSQARRNELIKLVDDTELNAVVIDLKDYSGRVFFDSHVTLAKEIKAQDLRIPDLKDLLAELKQKNIYRIARIAVFQDPYLAEQKPELALKSVNGGLWRDHKGLAWVDSASPVVWKYNLDLAKAAIKLGFEEINFDYIRFPSDGNLKQIVYPFYEESKTKAEVMKDFFAYINKELELQPAYVSIDLFGMTLWRDDGLGIGQRFEDAMPYVDYICPMVYPSHYPATFEGFQNPAEYPYEIVYKSLDKAKDIIKNQRAKFRPWLQDFDLGAVYTADMVRKQIQATNDAGWSSWFLWNASNNYTKEALLAK